MLRSCPPSLLCKIFWASLLREPQLVKTCMLKVALHMLMRKTISAFEVYTQFPCKVLTMLLRKAKQLLGDHAKTAAQHALDNNDTRKQHDLGKYFLVAPFSQEPTGPLTSGEPQSFVLVRDHLGFSLLLLATASRALTPCWGAATAPTGHERSALTGRA